MRYAKTLEAVENFMVKSGIRKYCSNVCKGKCCGDCYTSENACHKNEGKRLPCAIFTCYSLRNTIIPEKSFDFNDCTLEISYAYEQLKSVDDNIYFKPPKDFEAVKRNFKVGKQRLEILFDEELIKSIKKRIIKLGNRKVKG